MQQAGVAPTLAEWDALPGTVRDALPLVRHWLKELEADAAKKAADEARWRARGTSGRGGG